ncbi:myeloid-derived growth factor isoform X1 [Manis pentadactyla]|uniref:myeloid-derived growth factor isoform X1 n=1 Tax=Manis pentadactyla TaxID=143292 RepID=UPI00255C55A3|nr:myeloid-derived growth factor isoform X1 [Manis pentadactyla]
MAAPRERRDGGGSASLWAALLLTAVALRPAEAVSEPMTVAFDVRPGGVVHSFSQNAGPGDKYTCVFTYASQGGTNEKWQMSLGTSEDNQHFTCTIWSRCSLSSARGSSHLSCGLAPAGNEQRRQGQGAQHAQQAFSSPVERRPVRAPRSSQWPQSSTAEAGGPTACPPPSWLTPVLTLLAPIAMQYILMQ